MRPLLDFGDAGADDAEPAKGVTVGDIRAWHDEFERLRPHWKCKAQRTADPPQDCDWPWCGCDPYADKVLAAIAESGKIICPDPRLQFAQAQHAPPTPRIWGFD